jgi:hypothetical protein
MLQQQRQGLGYGNVPVQRAVEDCFSFKFKIRHSCQLLTLPDVD